MGPDHQSARPGGLTRHGALVYGADAEIAEWVARRIDGFHRNPEAKAIGVIKGGRVVAGVVYERYNGLHLEASIAAEPGSGWADRKTLFGLFHYPFGTLQCQAISAIVSVANLPSLNLVTKMGFEPEALIKFAAHDGGHLAVMKMYRENCRWIGHGKRKAEGPEGA